MEFEEAVDGSKEKWNRHPESYERIIVPIFRACAEEVVGKADIRASHKVLDIGSGTGLAALLAAGMVEEEGLVIGVDIAEAFLQLAREKTQKLGIKHAVFVKMDASSLQYPAEKFDVVISNRFIELEVMTRKLAFSNVENYLDTFLIGWYYNQAEFDAMPPESKRAFREEAIDALKDYVTGDGFAIETRVTYYKAVR